MDYNQYLSPFSWRYGSKKLRSIWSEFHKRKLWRQLWVSLAEVESQYGIVTSEQISDLKAHINDVDIPRALEIEADIHHDLMAELNTFAEQCPIGRSIIHLGATSMDIEDNADALRIKQSLDMIENELSTLLKCFAEQINTWAETPIMAFTHLQPAEPTTLGYRLSFYAQDLLTDFKELQAQKKNIKGKGFKGAVGTGASYVELIGKDNYPHFETALSEKIGLPFFPVSTQVYPRKQDLLVINLLANIGASLYKFAMDIRILQSPPIGEISEPFGVKQVGSSAMPFKRNPIRSEKINSLARALAQMPQTAWQNAAHSLLERTLDDSANRRSLLPEAFLICDELLTNATTIISKMNVNEDAIQYNFQTYAPFAATERLLMTLVKAGADRQEMHHIIREQSMKAWQDVRSGKPNPLTKNIQEEQTFTKYLSPEQILQCMQANNYLGLAPELARQMSDTILNTISN